MMEAIVLSWALSFGLVPRQLLAVDDTVSEYKFSNATTYASMFLSAEFSNRLTVATFMRSFQIPAEGSLGFFPFRMDFFAGVEYKLTPKITFGLSHECDHPVLSTFTPEARAKRFAADETRLYVDFHGRTNF